MNAQENQTTATRTNNTLPVMRVPQSMMLPDSDQWQNRFEIHSETSDRIYVIAQNKKWRRWGCSCPAYRTRRRCKHRHAVRPAYILSQYGRVP